MIRVATLNDYPAIAAFDPFGGDRRAELERGGVLVAESGDRIAGYVSFSPAGFIERPFVHYLAVSPAHRRGGVAVSLLRAVEDRVRPGRLFISTEDGNAPMWALLARDGWTPAGCVRGVNANGASECFFYRDLPAADAG